MAAARGFASVNIRKMEIREIMEEELVSLPGTHCEAWACEPGAAAAGAECRVHYHEPGTAAACFEIRTHVR